jgi:hypothetical protein
MRSAELLGVAQPIASCGRVCATDDVYVRFAPEAANQE